MYVRARLPAPTLAEHRAAVRDCLPWLALTAVTGVVLYLALFVIDLTPHMGPKWPRSVGLTVGALIALTAQGVAIGVSYRERLVSAQRRRSAQSAT